MISEFITMLWFGGCLLGSAIIVFALVQLHRNKEEVKK